MSSSNIAIMFRSLIHFSPVSPRIKILLEAARNAVDRHLRSQFSSGDETLLEVIENPDDADDPGARLRYPVVPDERTQEKLSLVVAQLERERDQHTSFVDTSANSCFGLLTQWQIEYITSCHKRWNLVRRNTGAHANDGAMCLMNFCKRWPVAVPRNTRLQRKRCAAQLRPGFSLSLRVLQNFDRIHDGPLLPIVENVRSPGHGPCRRRPRVRATGRKVLRVLR